MQERRKWKDKTGDGLYHSHLLAGAPPSKPTWIRHQVRYREINVASDTAAAEAMVRKSGQQGVPQTEINGQMIVGFDKNRINQLLEIK